jgi:glycosyltransferase involved in cell wall biosynthesis
LARAGAAIHSEWDMPAFSTEEDVLFYMNDYAVVFDNYAELWREALTKIRSLQLMINVDFGSLNHHPWLALHCTGIYFQNTDMEKLWAHVVRDSALGSVATFVLPSPVDLTPFLAIEHSTGRPVTIGRLVGDAPLPPWGVGFYEGLSRRLPAAEFWFMPAPSDIVDAFSDHPRFRLFAESEIPVREFLENTDIFCLPLKSTFPVNGPRSLVEAMAAGCAPVVPDRQGPKDRVVHGVSGYASNEPAAMAEFVTRLAEDAMLRTRIAAAARERASSWKISDWTDAILKHAGTESRQG